MITLHRTVAVTYPPFANHCLFHPTDAIEDPWGKRLLDMMAADGGIGTVRIYNMLEDIVYRDENGNLAYDFRLHDLRIDTLLARGFDILIAYAAMPDCIAQRTDLTTANAKNATRYKGKLFNTSGPADPALWEEVCYQYTRHIVEKYGIDTVAQWRLQCFNEPDIASFFLSDLPEGDAYVPARLAAYCPMYEGFARAVRRVSPRLRIGGPALSHSLLFLEGFLQFVGERKLPLDYIALHCYGTSPGEINKNRKPLRVSNITARHDGYMEVIERCGFADTPLVYDEWGASSCGFLNREECPALMFREHEGFSAFYIRMVYEMIRRRAKMEKMMICLSGQHEMEWDFSGFRNFFTKNFIRKPIYSAHLLTAMLGEAVLEFEGEMEEDFCLIPTRRSDGGYTVLAASVADDLSEDRPGIRTEIRLPDGCAGRHVVVYRIDKTHTNPYRLAQRMGVGDDTGAILPQLREEGHLRPAEEFVTDGVISVELEANGVAVWVVE